MSGQLIPVTNLRQMESQLRDLARDRGLPVIDAYYVDKGARVLMSSNTASATLIEAAVRTGAGFVTIEVHTFDEEDFIEQVRSELGKEDLVLPGGADEALKQEHHGDDDPERLILIWSGSGTVYSVVYVAAWADALNERLVAMAVEDTEPDEVQVAYARIAQLAGLIEALPEFRRTQPSKRRGAAAQLIERFAVESDDPYLRDRAIAEAHQRALRNSEQAYFAFDEERVGKIADMKATEDWQHAYSRPGRIAAATRFMTEATGYAPTKSAAEEFARIAT